MVSTNLDAVKRGYFRHYKGGVYLLLNIGTHSETQEPMVIYRSTETGKLWVRPAAMFFEDVTVGNVTQPRFKRLNSWGETT